MNTIQYVNARRKLKCKKVKQRKKPLDHQTLGRILGQKLEEREKMEAQKPELQIMAGKDLDFIC